MTSPKEPTPLAELAFWLAVRHQDEQQSIADKVAAGLALLWPILRFDRLDETSPAWLHAVTLQVERGFRESERLAFDFVQGQKWSVEPFADVLSPVETVFPVRDFQLGMQATGPVSVKRRTSLAFAGSVGDSGALSGGAPSDVLDANLGRLADDLMARARIDSTGVAVKHVLNGGRGEVQEQVVVDARDRFRNREPIGWARFTEDSKNGPCYFCALLASQGAVYLGAGSFDESNSKMRDIAAWMPLGDVQGEVASLVNESGGVRRRRAFLGDGPAKVHDHCKCSMRPVYRERDAMDARAKYFLRQWQKAPGTSVNEFRKVYKRPPPYSERPAVSLDVMRRNRELVADVLGVSSPHVRWWDRQIALVESAS